MNMKQAKDELDLAADEFINSFNAFEKSAKKVMAIMDSMRKKNNEGLKPITGKTQQTHKFLIQMMDDSGQIGEKCFGIRCVAEEQRSEP